MIAPDFRDAHPINLKEPAKKFIEANHGTELWLALEPAIIEIQQTRDELKNAAIYKCDVEQLKKVPRPLCQKLLQCHASQQVLFLQQQQRQLYQRRFCLG